MVWPAVFGVGPPAIARVGLSPGFMPGRGGRCHHGPEAAGIDARLHTIVQLTPNAPRYDTRRHTIPPAAPVAHEDGAWRHTMSAGVLKGTKTGPNGRSFTPP